MYFTINIWLNIGAIDVIIFHKKTKFVKNFRLKIWTEIKCTRHFIPTSSPMYLLTSPSRWLDLPSTGPLWPSARRPPVVPNSPSPLFPSYHRVYALRRPPFSGSTKLLFSKCGVNALQGPAVCCKPSPPRFAFFFF